MVTAVRDAVEQVIEDEPFLLSEIIDILEGHGWAIFRRLSLHALRVFKSEAPELVHSHLANGDVAQDWELEREYVLLLADAFPSLLRERQNEILRVITEGPDRAMLREEADKDGYVRRWQWQRLSPIRDSLTNGPAELWQRLRAEFGEQSPLPEEGVVLAQWGAPTVLGTDKLAGMPVHEIADFIGGFEPAQRFFGPSAEDLAAELEGAVSASPERFSIDLAAFSELQPIYLVGLLRGFSEAAEVARLFEWGEVLDLCAHLLVS